MRINQSVADLPDTHPLDDIVNALTHSMLVVSDSLKILYHSSFPAIPALSNRSILEVPSVEGIEIGQITIFEEGFELSVWAETDGKTVQIWLDDTLDGQPPSDDGDEKEYPILFLGDVVPLLLGLSVFLIRTGEAMIRKGFSLFHSAKVVEWATSHSNGEYKYGRPYGFDEDEDIHLENK